VAFLKCPLCHKNLTEPCTLPCLHSFCRSCVVALQQPAPSSVFRCPTCQAQGNAPSLECSEFIQSLSKFSQSLPKKFESGVVLCDVCEASSAIVYCRECSQPLCQGCQYVHRKFKGNASHECIPLDKAKEIMEDRAKERVIRCHQHSDMEITTYCKQCAMHLCSVCLTERHSGHPFDHISNVRDMWRERIVDLTLTVEKREKEADVAESSIKGVLDDLKHRDKSVNEELDNVFRELQESLDERRQLLHSEVASQIKARQETAKTECDQAGSAKLQLAGFREFNEGLLVWGNSVEIVASYKRVKELFPTSCLHLGANVFCPLLLDSTAGQGT